MSKDDKSKVLAVIGGIQAEQKEKASFLLDLAYALLASEYRGAIADQTLRFIQKAKDTIKGITP